MQASSSALPTSATRDLGAAAEASPGPAVGDATTARRRPAADGARPGLLRRAASVCAEAVAGLAGLAVLASVTGWLTFQMLPDPSAFVPAKRAQASVVVCGADCTQPPAATRDRRPNDT